MADKAKEKESKSIAPWLPFMDLTLFERDMERMMDDFFGRRIDPGGPRGGFGRKASRSAGLQWTFMKRRTTSLLRPSSREWRKTTLK